MILNKKSFITSLLFIVIIVGIFYFLSGASRSIYIGGEGGKTTEQKQEGLTLYEPNSLSGTRCENYKRRPLAVMIAEDIEARPLSGLASADLIVEMPVVSGSITRMMAVFVCSDAEEIGSVRSARDDFIPIAQGYDTIYAHWGGSKMALDELGRGVIDNLDALPNPFGVFYRKRGIPMPHDGFTSIEKMMSAASRLGYRLVSELGGYKFTESGAHSDAIKVLEIGYRRPYNVRYEYYPSLNSYLRWRGGTKETDKLTGDQVAAKNIVVMRATSRPIGGGYNDVDVIGSGEASVYRNGERLSGKWIKDGAKDMLRFYGTAGVEIEFTPGQIWVEIVEPDTLVDYR